VRLLLFNLVTDVDHPVLGFTTVWINALARYYASIDVLTMSQGRLAVADNVNVYSVGREKGYSEPRRAVEFYCILSRLLRKHQYDACFAHMQPLFALMGWPLLALYRIPITLWYAHKNVPQRVRLAEKVVDHIVTSSLEGFRLPSRKILVVGQGIDTETFIPVESSTAQTERPFTIVNLGRIVPIKRLEVMVETARLLAQEGIAFRMLIVGAPSDHEGQKYFRNIQEQARSYGLSGCIEFPGGVPYNCVPDVYRQADVMVNVSDTGSIDKAILEAMACGLPVITANEAYKPILQAWNDQLLIPHDAPTSEAAHLLTQQLKAMMSQTQEERRDLGLALRQIVVEQHSLERLTLNLLHVFKTGTV
jgi:glycosyltransferase involved in cell wall biosynthesis